MPGKLFVLDGLDGSGKTTQTALAAEALEKAGHPVKIISFPDYSQESSALVRMYLNGELSKDPDGVNAYAASSFYAVDRYASFQKFWKNDYEAGHTILATRYVSSNAIHQMVKLPKEEWDAYLRWLSDFEYGKLGLPRPDRVLFLDMDRAVADKLLLKRYGGDASREDLHERDRLYLSRCQQSAAYAAKAEGWAVIPCDDGENPLPPEEITGKILEIIKKSL
ncbi:MAG TPA: thymidylate kinase [Candidatus Merdivicinus intestinigallinarum]|nr:thymidylate kinase [Candidatus Merdivicinus intestinigallinarum]